MANVFDDFRNEYWFHVSNQNEMHIFGQVEKSIDLDLLYNIAHNYPDGSDLDNFNYLKKVIKDNVDSIDTLRTIVGVTDKRLYLELSYIFNKHGVQNDGTNVISESVYALKKHPVSFFKRLISSNRVPAALDIITKYLVERGVLSILGVFYKISREELNSIVSYLLLPKEIQQEETKRRGHGAEQALAEMLHNLGVSFIPENRHINPMSSQDPNVDKKTFELSERNERTTWSMDLIIKNAERLTVYIQGLIHSSDPGQYGVNKSGESVTVKNDINAYNSKNPNLQARELWGLVDGVGFIENPENTIFKMLGQFDTFVQLKSLYKAGLKLHKLGIVKIKAIKFDMTFYSDAQANEMFAKYGSDDITKVIDQTEPEGYKIPAGKAWLYIDDKTTV